MANIKNEPEWFAGVMRAKLETPKNLAKGHWNNMSFLSIFDRILDETNELEEAIKCFDWTKDKSYDEILSECADIANFCMMLADNVEKMRELNSSEIHEEPKLYNG